MKPPVRLVPTNRRATPGPGSKSGKPHALPPMKTEPLGPAAIERAPPCVNQQPRVEPSGAKDAMLAPPRIQIAPSVANVIAPDAGTPEPPPPIDLTHESFAAGVNFTSAPATAAAPFDRELCVAVPALGSRSTSPAYEPATNMAAAPSITSAPSSPEASML